VGGGMGLICSMALAGALYMYSGGRREGAREGGRGWLGMHACARKKKARHD